jgi:PAS domain S-box-containing protein
VIFLSEPARKENRNQWLASFPEMNPNPVIELNAQGEITFANPATLKILKDLGFPQNPEFFVPDDKEEILRMLREPTVLQIYREINLNNAWFSENITLNHELQVMRIYTTDISWRKRMEEELRRAYDHTSTILESISDSFIALDKNWRFTYVNRRALEYMNKNRKDVLGKIIWEVLPAIIGTPLETFYRMAMVSSQPCIFKNTSVVASGEKFELHAYPMQDGLSIIGQNITERERAYEALRESQDRTTSILEGIADTFYSLDEQWRFTMINPAAEKAPFGRPAAELLGRVIWDLYPNLVGTQIHRYYLEAAEKHTLENYEAKSPLNNQWYDVFMQGRKGGIDVYMRDISQRKHAEEALRESETRFSLAQKGSGTGTWDWNITKGEIIWSPQLYDLFGVDPKKTSASFDTWNDVLHPDDKEGANARIEKALATHTRLDSEYRIIRPDHKVRWINALGEGVYDDNGQAVRMYGICIDITKRHQAEEALRQREEQLQRSNDLLEAVTKGTDVIIAVQDTSFHYLYFNDAYNEEIKRLTGKEITIGSSMAEVFADVPKEQKRAINEWSRVLKGENVNEKIEFGNQGLDRKVYHVLHTPIQDAQGTIVGAGEVAFDITKQVEMEDALRETKEYLDNLINYANAPIIVWDPQFRITLFNRAFEHLTGRKAKDIIGEGLEILLPEKYLIRAMDLIKKTSEGERWESVEIPILHKKGEIRTVLWNSAAILGSDGKTIVSTIAQGQDITERKKIESEYRLKASEYAKMNVALEEEILQRKSADANLKNTLSLLHASLESTADGILVVDREGTVTSHNQNFVTMWNIPSEIVKTQDNQKIITYFQSQIRDPDGFLANMNDLLLHPSRESYDMIELNDGRIFERYSKPQKIGKDVIGRVWSFRDITDRKRSEEKLVASLQEKEVLLREIHHRVKNNLQLITGLLDMTRMRTQDETTTGILTDMMLKIQTMAQIHTRLYESKQFGKIGLTGQFRDQVAALSNIYSYKGHEISCEIHAEEIFLPVDQALPCALVMNEILSNSYKHAFKGKKHGTIDVSAVQENGHIRITVKDNGIGISPDFDISRTSSLGMKLIRTLVKHQLKGSLHINSHHGTEMIVEFPLHLTRT